MDRRSKWIRIIVSVLCAVVISVGPFLWASASLYTFETQYDHESADPAWLTDLVFKEDMSSVNGLAQRCELVAKPSYPYTETPESFRKDVENYCYLYTLNQGSGRAAYIYFFDVLGTQSGNLLAGEISDDDIRTYLESVGVVYPDDPDDDELIVARALYGAMISGAFTGVTAGASLEEVMVTYLASLTGVNIDTLREWMPADSVLSLDSYILAASRLALWTNGYDVTDDLSEDDIFRLVAVMTIEQMGISADSSLSFDELKYKYMAAMLGKKYGVNVDDARLAAALESGDAAFYMLQLLGKQGGVSIREDNSTYEEAFDLVAENTGIFDVQVGEFYADIDHYELTLAYKRSSLWIYPTAYVTGDSSYTVTIDVNGTPVRNGYYTEVPIDPEKPYQTLAVSVVAISAKDSSQCVYYIDLRQGGAAQVTPQQPTDPAAASSNPFISSESIVAQVMTTFGLDPSILSSLGSSFFSLTLPTQNVLSYLSPSFDAESLFADDGQTVMATAVTVLSDDQYKAVLDEIGNLADSGIRGIDGTELSAEQLNGFDLSQYITFDK